MIRRSLLALVSAASAFAQVGPFVVIPPGRLGDTEFAAGYFEMFFRNPNYFAAQNPDLYQGYVELFNYDPRRAWKEDFPFYVTENRNFYLVSGQRPWTPNLTVPEV